MIKYNDCNDIVDIPEGLDIPALWKRFKKNLTVESDLEFYCDYSSFDTYAQYSDARARYRKGAKELAAEKSAEKRLSYINQLGLKGETDYELFLYWLEHYQHVHFPIANVIFLEDH